MGEDAYFMDFGYGTITKLKLINETKCKIIRDFQNTISVRRIRRLKMPVCLYDLTLTTECPTIEFSLCFACFLGFNSPGDEDSKTHLTFLPISKIDQVTEQNMEQP